MINETTEFKLIKSELELEDQNNIIENPSDYDCVAINYINGDVLYASIDEFEDIVYCSNCQKHMEEDECDREITDSWETSKGDCEENYAIRCPFCGEYINN